jgi:hypothetical protein
MVFPKVSAQVFLGVMHRADPALSTVDRAVFHSWIGLFSPACPQRFQQLLKLWFGRGVSNLSDFAHQNGSRHSLRAMH